MNGIKYSPKVSVIVPIYNVEPYLIQCISSIQNQTYLNMEIICVDDNSSDKSAEILKELALNDDRIIAVYNSQSMGAAYCRNLGIKMSKGEYLIFLDSDDYFDKELIERGINAFQKYNADIVAWDSFFLDCAMNELRCNQSLTKRFLRKIDEPFSPKEFADYIFDMLSVAPWYQMYRREIVTSNGLYFQSLPNSNDVYFCYITRLYAKKIVYLPERLVYYRINRFGQISEYRGKNPECAYEALFALYNRMIKDDLFHFYKKSFYYSALNVILHRGRLCNDEKIKADFDDFMSQTGWKNLGMERLKREDFVSEFQFSLWEIVVKNKNWEAASKMCIETFYNEKLINRLKNFGQRFCLWGFGIKGKNFLNIAQKYNMNIVGIVDINSNLWGDYANGLKVLPLESQPTEFDTILLITSKYYDEVKKSLYENGKSDLKIIDIDTLVIYNYFRWHL